MRTRDKMAFALAAKQFNCWILVRRTNPASLKYIGEAGYTPKPIDCKAKTANNASHPLAGLVVDPTRVPQAFAPEKLGKVKKTWESFQAMVHPGEPGFSVNVDSGSDRFGCVTLHGKYLYGDYDLKDVILADQMHRNLASVESLRGQKHMRGPRILAIQQFVNARIGADMVQHGGEAQYADHSDEPIDAFGPNMDYKSFLNGQAVISWYREINRNVIDTSEKAARSKPAPPAYSGPPNLRLIRGGRS